jgi:hypothetical protein
VRNAQHWKAGQAFAFIPKGSGVLLVPAPDAKDLKGIVSGAAPTGYRDRADRD